MYNVRSADIYRPRDFEIVIAGCGGGGSHLAFLLARMGFARIKIYDDDVVAEENIGTQLFRIQDIGKTKVSATQGIVREFTGVEIEAIAEKCESVTTDVLILQVDGMGKRKKIFDNSTFDLIIDGRAGPENFAVISVYGFEREQYMRTWFPPSESAQLPCGAKATSYNAFGSAAMEAMVVKRYNNGEDIPSEQHFCYKTLTHTS